ncbi:MAG TPA: methyltransferase [Gemmataceae bacterium]|nr:methyltransferase [Gemmataceae bacterium]
MPPRRPPAEPPPLYAMVLPGLEAIAAEEISDDLGGEVKKSGHGLVVFRAPEVERVLELSTTEDVFLLAWGSDALTYRAEDLKSIRRWTAHDADWGRLLAIHHALRPKPKGKPSYHLVAQMHGQHGYRRVDALEALAGGLAGHFPASWRPVGENAAVEVWLTIDGRTAVCGLRLSDRSMRHRSWKQEHLPASLRPTVAAAMVRLAEPRPDMRLVDPMCGAGTILGEAIAYARRHRLGTLEVCGGDQEANAVRAAETNLRHLGPARLERWDAVRLPLDDASADQIVSNPPFGKQLSRPEEVGPLYHRMVPEYDRVLKPGGRAVLLVSEDAPLREAARAAGWKLLRQVDVRVLGQPAVITVWRKPG